MTSAYPDRAASESDGFATRYALVLATAIGLLGGIFSCLAWELRSWERHTLTGPDSPAGYRALIEVSDCFPIGPGADYYADVKILSPDVKDIYSWEDPDGQDSYAAVKEMRTSMSWIDDSTLVFRCISGMVTIKRQQSGEWNHEIHKD